MRLPSQILAFPRWPTSPVTVAGGLALFAWAVMLTAPLGVTPPTRSLNAVDGSPQDPWKPRGIVERGIYAGYELDTDHFRSASLLTSEQAASYNPVGREVLVANFRHANQWFVARIPIDQIADLIFHLELIPNEFPGVHNQLRMVMKEGGEATLLPQRVGDAANPVKLKNLLLSSEGNFAPGTSFNWRGGPEQSSVAHMAMSMEQKAVIMGGGGIPHDVIQVFLKVDDAKKREVVLAYLNHATRVGTDEMFDLATWNCATPLFDVLDKTLDYGPLRNMLAVLSVSSMPHWSLQNLDLRGLTDHDRKLPNFFDEFPL